MAADLSLAVAAKGDCDPRPFLAALAAQDVPGAGAVRVHIAHDNPWPVETGTAPAGVTLHACAPGTSILRLWGSALAHSSGEYVAVLDINCPPAPGWLEAVLAEIGRGSALFFGPVDPGWGQDDRRIIGYLAEYAQFCSPLDPALDEVPGNNLVCRRSLLEDSGKLQAVGFFKTFMVWRLQQERQLAPLRCDAMIVHYRKPFRFGHYVQRRFIHGRCFGATRHDNAGQPPRLLCIGFTLVLPLVRTWRIYRAVRNRPGLRAAFRRYLGAILASETAWSAGELSGYTLGGRVACDRLD